MDELAINKDAPAVLTDIPRFSTPEPAPAAVAVAPIRIPALNLSLFAITMLTTTMAGAFWSGADLSFAHPLADLATLPAGISFSIPLMAILLAHEMGHYLTARRHGVDTSLPYFIPAPPALFLIGTFGAFIRMRQMPRTRRVMFDIGAAGPWAGAIVAIPAVIIGLLMSDVSPLDKGAGGLELGNSLLFDGLVAAGAARRSVDRDGASASDRDGGMGRTLRHDDQLAASRPARRRTRGLRAVPAPSSHYLDAVRGHLRADGDRAVGAQARFLAGMAVVGGAGGRARIGTSVDRRSRHTA